MFRWLPVVFIFVFPFVFVFVLQVCLSFLHLFHFDSPQAANFVDTMSRLPGMAGEANDGVSAETHARSKFSSLGSATATQFFRR